MFCFSGICRFLTLGKQNFSFCFVHPGQQSMWLEAHENTDQFARARTHLFWAEHEGLSWKAGSQFSTPQEHDTIHQHELAASSCKVSKPHFEAPLLPVPQVKNNCTYQWDEDANGSYVEVGSYQEKRAPFL